MVEVHNARKEDGNDVEVDDVRGGDDDEGLLIVLDLVRARADG